MQEKCNISKSTNILLYNCGSNLKMISEMIFKDGEKSVIQLIAISNKN